VSIVRDNMMTQRGYTPYCGNQHCGTMPRTFWNGAQMQCRHCGWQSSFELEFVAAYTEKWSIGDDE